MSKYEIIRSDRAADTVMVGETVYDRNGPDYGLSCDDTRMTGIEHITVTRDSAGNPPGFTIPIEDLKELPA